MGLIGQDGAESDEHGEDKEAEQNIKGGEVVLMVWDATKHF